MTRQARRAVLFVSVLALTLIAAVSAVLWQESRSLGTDPSFTSVTRQVQYGFTLQNTMAALSSGVEFCVEVPLARTPTQERRRLEANHPFEILTDGCGNEVMLFHLKPFPPFATRIVTISAELSLRNAPRATPAEDLSRFLRPEAHMEADAPAVVQLAQSLKKAKGKDTVTEIFRWVADNVLNTGTLPNSRGALYALKTRRGDCTEFMSLFVALCRACGIPARGMAGYVIQRDGVLKAGEYHNWAEFQEDGLWKLADPQRRVLRTDGAHYLAMRQLGKSEAPLLADNRRFNVNAGVSIRVVMDQ